MNASFEEKSTWLTLAGLVGVFAVYFTLAGRMLAAGVTAVAPYVPLLAVTIVLLVVLVVVGHVAVAIVHRRHETDERDRLIEWRSESRSGWILATGAVTAIFALALPIAPAWIANGLLLALFLSEAVKQVLKLVDYRRGF